MKLRPILGAASAGLLLVSCGSKPEPKLQPADIAILLDDSKSYGLRTSPQLREKAALRVRKELLTSGAKLGDKVLLFRIGERNSGQIMPDILPLNRQHSVIAVANEVHRRILAMDENAGDGENQTSILLPLEHGGIKCGPDGRGLVIGIGDFLEESESFADLPGQIAGTSHLPAPHGKPMANCRVLFMGLLAGEGPVLSSNELAALSADWDRWLIDAGARTVSISPGF